MADSSGILLSKERFSSLGDVTKYPILVFGIAFLVLWISSRLGAWFHSKRRELEADEREDFGVIVAATLTLLGLVIGFTFSMAISRYDLRKTYEEAEANAIGTEYVRADFLPTGDAAKVRDLLKIYTDQRISFYRTREHESIQQINSATAHVQDEMWNIVQTAAKAQPTPVMGLVVSGMNDVLNSQGYTQAAWWNRIPSAAWALMIAIGVFCNLLIGFGARRAGSNTLLFLVLPLVVAISFFLIADIDSPRRGIIRVQPQNLISLQQSLQGH
jgi:hypothetical protein